MNIFAQKKYKFALSTVIGGGIGYFLIHPAVMILGHVMSKSEMLHQYAVSDIIAHELAMSFSLSMIPWSSAFTIAGMMIGFLFGKLFHVHMILKNLSYLDGLTGIANRRHFQENLEYEWRSGIRTGMPLSLIMCDIDYFKSYNDLYGHPMGDECLKKVVSALTRSLDRPRDLAARYGGEEFAVVLPETDASGAWVVAERIRQKVAALSIPHDKSTCDCKMLTVSIGIATVMPARKSSVAEPVSLADRALYDAKKSGRNRIKSAGIETNRAENNPCGQMPVMGKTDENSNYPFPITEWLV